MSDCAKPGGCTCIGYRETWKLGCVHFRPNDAPQSVGGTKHDDGKPRMELLPSGPLTEISKVLAFGAQKYSDHNWRKGFKQSRLIGAAMRHLSAYNDGIDNDEETGLSHVAHAACCLLFLLEHQQRGIGTDDRYKASTKD